MKYTVQPGKRYRAKIRLGLFEAAVAGEGTIREKLADAGFLDVRVWGSGRDYTAEGTWHGAPQSADLPDQIVAVEPLP